MVPWHVGHVVKKSTFFVDTIAVLEL